MALLPGKQERQVDGTGEKDAAGEVKRVVHAQPDAACHDEHRPGDDGAADETAAAVGKADDAGKEERPAGSEGGVAGGEAVAGFFGAVRDEVRRRLRGAFGVVGADGISADAAFDGVEVADARGVVFGEDDDVRPRLADERFEQAFTDLRRAKADEDDEQQRAPFAATVCEVKECEQRGGAEKGDGYAAGLSDDVEQIIERDFVALPAPAGKPESGGDKEEQGGDGEEAGFHGW